MTPIIATGVAAPFNGDSKAIDQHQIESGCGGRIAYARHPVAGKHIADVLIRQDMVRMLSDQQFAATARTAADIDAKLDNERDALVRVAKGMPATILASPTVAFAYFAQRPGLLAAFDELWMVRPDGSFLSDLPHVVDRAPLNASELADLDRLRADWQPIISHPARNKSDGDSAIEIMAPVLTSEGRFGGALVAVVKLMNKNLLGTLVDAKVGKSGVFVMVTKEAKPVFLLHPRKDMILKGRPENPDSGNGPSAPWVRRHCRRHHHVGRAQPLQLQVAQ